MGGTLLLVVPGSACPTLSSWGYSFTGILHANHPSMLIKLCGPSSAVATKSIEGLLQGPWRCFHRRCWTIPPSGPLLELRGDQEHSDDCDNWCFRAHQQCISNQKKYVHMIVSSNYTLLIPSRTKYPRASLSMPKMSPKNLSIVPCVTAKNAMPMKPSLMWSRVDISNCEGSINYEDEDMEDSESCEDFILDSEDKLDDEQSVMWLSAQSYTVCKGRATRDPLWLKTISSVSLRFHLTA